MLHIVLFRYVKTIYLPNCFFQDKNALNLNIIIKQLFSINILTVLYFLFFRRRRRKIGFCSIRRGRIRIDIFRQNKRGELLKVFTRAY